MTGPELLLAAVGAVLTVGSAMIAGYRLHVLARWYAPGIGALLPRDAGAVAGFAIGLATVTHWLT